MSLDTQYLITVAVVAGAECVRHIVHRDHKTCIA